MEIHSRYAYINIYIYIYANSSIHIDINIHIVCVCVCVCEYASLKNRGFGIFPHRQRETERKTERKTEREREVFSLLLLSAFLLISCFQGRKEGEQS